MSPRLRIARLLPPALWAPVVALALMNPFCCCFMPCFKAEVVQHEIAWDAADGHCPGKPRSLRAETLVQAPVDVEACEPLSWPAEPVARSWSARAEQVAGDSGPPPLERSGVMLI